jgi:hypothetical protein
LILKIKSKNVISYLWKSNYKEFQIVKIQITLLEKIPKDIVFRARKINNKQVNYWMLSKNPLFLRMLMISTKNCPKIHKLKELKIKQI